MEKFAVDLEKVLDEFEYNEEREENVTAPSIKNPPLPHLGLGALRQLPAFRPPAASYRRPSFEPINLADADFAASPPKPSTTSFNLGMSGKQNENGETFSYRSSKTQLNNRNYALKEDNDASSLQYEVNINKQIIIESEDTSSSKIWQNAHSSVPIEEKPDLLEYNSKNADLDSDNIEINNQLPDITTSVRVSCHGVNNNEVDNLSNSLDLISSTSANLVNEDNEIDGSKMEKKVEEVSESLEKSLTLDYRIHTENNVAEHEKILSPSLISEINCFDSATGGFKIQVDNFPSLDRQFNSVVNQDSELSKHASQIVVSNKEDVMQNDSETYPVNGFSTNVLPELSEEKQSDEYKIQTDYVEQSDAQIVLTDSIKPIGFSADSDVSESELEEYLRELEVLDEKNLVYNTTSAPEKSEIYVNEMGTEKDERDCELALSDLNDAKIVCGNITDSQNYHEERKIEEQRDLDDKQNSSKFRDFAEDTPPSPKQNQNKSLDNQSSTSVTTAEVLPFESVSSVSSSVEINSGNESVKDESKERGAIKEHVLVETSVTVIKRPEDIEEKNNPFLSSDTLEPAVSVEKITKNNEKIIENRSTNPFEEVLVVEVNKKSTNPFEEDDDNHNEESVLESPEHPKLEVATKHISSFESSEKTCENIATKTATLTQIEKVIPEPISSNSAEKTITEALTVPTSAAASLVSDSHEKIPPNYDGKTITSISSENSSTECAPSCSNAHNEALQNSLESTAKMIPIKKAFESPTVQNVDESGIVAEEDKPSRPNSLELPRRITVEASTHESPNAGELERELGSEDRRLGKIAPFWIPDADSTSCMQCQLKFNVIKRRHHCRACGQVLCSKCCGLRARLEYMNFAEARVCQPCFTILEEVSASESTSPLGRQPNPNNPMEYCSTIPPLQQAAGSLHQPPPSVMVPVGVLKREGRSKSDVTKQVMFSDGIRPGGDLTELDGSGEPRMPFRRPGRLTKRVGTPPGGMMSPSLRRVLDPTTLSFIPAEGDSSLPPVVTRLQGEVSYSDLESPVALNQPTIKFALNRNLFVVVKRVLLDCCVNRECWCFSTEGLACVGQDEIVFLLECLPQETLPPKDVFLLINLLYQDAAKGSTVSEMSFTPATSNNLLGSRDHGGFLYIRTSYQCTTQLVLPSPPYLVALLIHRWETPWARLFPIRLVLRLGAEFRYYPCPLVSVRNRPPLYTDIGHTIINILADFRKYSYTLPSVRGLVIHMEDRQTTINIPRNRYDQVVRALNNSNDSVLAFGANLSLAADSHLVCMQSTEDENTSYHTQAINIHNKPRRVTGASFVVFNGALKVPGLAGKSNIVEDGLMVQVPSETMVALRTALRDMRDYSIGCGPNAEETVVLQWTADDTNFNIGVKSCIDGRALDGVPSIRVHNGTDYSGGARIIRWTEVFILQCEDSEHSSEPLDISRLSESIARATCLALVPLLDLLSAASLTTLAVRTTIHPDNVGYEAGSNGEKLPPLYMKSLDDELVCVVHQAALSSQDNPAVLELVFRIMEQG